MRHRNEEERGGEGGEEEDNSDDERAVAVNGVEGDVWRDCDSPVEEEGDANTEDETIPVVAGVAVDEAGGLECEDAATASELSTASYALSRSFRKAIVA